MQVMRAGPDIDEDQRPEVDDGEPVRPDRPLSPLRDEIIHDGEKAGGEEESHRVVAVPPLGHRILHAGEQRIALRAEQRDRQRQIVDDMQHGHRDHEAEIEPVRDIDVRLGALRERAEEHADIGEPHDGQPDVGVPFGLRIFAALRDAQHIAGRGDDDEEIVAPEHEPWRDRAGKACAAGALNDVEGCADQRIAAEGKDHRRRMQRPQPAEIRPGKPKVDLREGERPGDVVTDREADDAPEDGRDHADLDDVVVIFGVRNIVVGAHPRLHAHDGGADREGDREDRRMDAKRRVRRHQRHADRKPEQEQ